MTCIAVLSISSAAWAQSYPTRTIRLVVPFPAGGPADIYGRLMANWLSPRLQQPVIVENRVGAGGNIGSAEVAHAPPDGYTLLLGSPANPWAPALYANLTYDPAELVPVASIYKTPIVLVVRPSLPVQTLPELIAYAKANPDKITMASGGAGSAPHGNGELFKSMAGIKMLHVPYRGSAPAITDLLAGHVDLMFDPISTLVEHVKSGRLRALGVTSAMRSRVLPDVPAIGEFVPGFESVGWVGIFAPKNTPPEIVQRLNTEVNAGLTNSDIKARILAFGAETFPGTPEEFRGFVTNYSQKWQKLLRDANIRAE